MKYFTWDDHKKELLKKPGFRRAYENLEMEYSIASALIEARMKKGLSQVQVARKMNTTQSVISRLESGGITPSLSFLKRLASTLNLRLSVTFQ